MAKATSTITLKFKGEDQVSAVINKTNRGLQVMGKGLTSFSQKSSKAQATSTSFASALGNLSKIGKAGVNTFLNFGNSIRLASQGLMSIGKSMALFLTPVIFLTIKKAADVAIKFNAALVRVSKTTQLTGANLKALSDGIRDMGIRTATSQVDLAKMAEQIGQLGVRDVPSILSLIDTFNMLTLATEISSDKVAIAMGKIANAFGIDLNTEEGAEEIRILSSVINRLENELAAAAPEILKGLENLAQVGSILDFPPATGAAFIAALVSVGFGAEEAGTALRNMTIKVVQNADAVAQLMSKTEGYGSQQEVLTAINEDAAGVLIDLVHAASLGDDAAGALFATIEAGGIRGGKAWAALAGGIETFDKALAVANDEVLSGMSLWLEYQQALLSTENQMKVLRNNVNEVALVLGDTLLPVLNELIQTVIPALRWLAERFKELPPEIKKNILVIALLVGVAGPLLLFVSQLGFGLAMLMMSFGRGIQVIGTMIGALFSLGGALLGITGSVGGLLTASNLLIAGLVAGAVLLLMKFTGLGTAIAGFFTDLGSKAAAWGANLVATYGEGMLSAAASVLGRVLTAIGNFIGRFLAGSSPPEVGPLSHIDKWGQNVFDAFLGGFMKADFSILSRVGSVIEKIFSTLAKTELIGEKDQWKFAMKARQDLAKLIDVFNETGEISQQVLDDITANLGEAADEVQELIRHWLEYNRIQKELADLERKREGVLDTYRQEIQLIAQANMTAEEKAAAIRAAMKERDEELRLIAEEERGLEKAKDIAEEQLEVQRAMIDAMQHQDDLQARLIDSLDKMAGSLDKLGDFQFPSLEGLGTTEWQDDLDDAYNSIVTLEEQIGKMSGIWDAFVLGFQGEPLDISGFLTEQIGPDYHTILFRAGGLDKFDPELAGIVDKMENMHELGGKVGGVWDDVSGFFVKVGDFIEGIKTGDISIFPPGMAEDVEKIADAFEPIGKFFGEHGADILLFLGLFKGLSTVFKLIAGIDLTAFFASIGTFFSGGIIGEITAFIGLIVEALLGGGGLVAVMEVIVALLGAPVALALAFAGLFVVIKKFGPRAWKTLEMLWFIIKTKVGGLVTKIADGIRLGLEKMGEAWDDFKEKASEKWEEIKQTVSDKVTDLWESIRDGFMLGVQNMSDAWTDLKDRAGQAWRDLKDSIALFLAELGLSILAAAQGIVDGVVNTWNALKERAAEIWEGVKTAIGTKIEEAKTAITTKWEEIKLAIETKIGEIIAAISTKWDEVKTTVETKWGEIKTAIETKWGEIKTAVETKVGEIITVIEGWLTEIIGFFGLETLVGAGKDLIEGLRSGISTKVEEVKTWLSAKLTELLGIFAKILKLGSPSRETMKYGMWMMEGMAEGITGASGMLQGALETNLGLGLETAQNFALAGAGFPIGASPVIGGGGGGNVILQFGRDSVRSDEDIEEITDAVERLLSRRAEENISVGSVFGGDVGI